MGASKLLTFMLILLAIQVTLVMVDKEPISQEDDSPLWGLFRNPTDWSNSVFTSFLGGLAITIAAGLVVGGMIFKNEYMIFGSTIAVLIGFGTPIFALWSVVSREVGLFGAEPAISGLIASLLVSPLAIGYVWSIISWWRGNQEL